MHGDEEAKRLVLQTVCSNPMLKDQRLSIQTKKRFRPVAATASVSLLRAVVEDVRTLASDKEFTEDVRRIKRLQDKFSENTSKPEDDNT